MSMSIRNQKQFNEVTCKVWGQLFGIFIGKPGRQGVLMEYGWP